MGGWGRVGWDGWVGQDGVGTRRLGCQLLWKAAKHLGTYLDLVQCAECGCSDVVLIDIGLLML